MLLVLVIGVDMLDSCRGAHGEGDQGGEHNGVGAPAGRSQESLQGHALRAGRATATLKGVVAIPAWFPLQT